MTRWDIINHLIEQNDYKSYLEIGYYKGWSFDQVRCNWKTAVDPNPCKTLEQEVWPKGYGTIDLGNNRTAFSSRGSELIVKLTSDEFFNKIEEDATYDIIFIDGLHDADQVKKDITNSLKHLSVDGVIILHDCNPPLYGHTTTGIDGCWTGDAYKAVLKYKEGRFDNQLYVVDTDWGVGILHATVSLGDFSTIPVRDYKQGIESWAYFDKNRKELLNLVSVNDFLNIETKTK